MHLVHVVLTSKDTPQPTHADAERLLDILWAHLDQRSGIEHMRTRSGPTGIDLGVFFRGDGAETEVQVASAIGQLLACIPDWTPHPLHGNASPIPPCPDPRSPAPIPHGEAAETPMKGVPPPHST